MRRTPAEQAAFNALASRVLDNYVGEANYAGPAIGAIAALSLVLAAALVAWIVRS